eukprot:PRCOL_00007278-RA
MRFEITCIFIYHQDRGERPCPDGGRRNGEDGDFAPAEVDEGGASDAGVDLAGSEDGLGDGLLDDDDEEEFVVWSPPTNGGGDGPSALVAAAARAAAAAAAAPAVAAIATAAASAPAASAARYRGVTFDPKRRCYTTRVYLGRDSRGLKVGSFLTLEDAVAAYDRAAPGILPDTPAGRRRMKARRLYPTGISRDKKGFQAKLSGSETVDGKRAYVGRFKSEEEAVAAREMALQRVQRGEPPRPASRKKQHSKYRGVTWIERNKRWRANLVDGKGIPRYVGQFRDEKAAARAWDRAVRKARGPGAFQNFPAASPPSAEDETAEDARDGPSALAGAAAEDGNASASAVGQRHGGLDPAATRSHKTEMGDATNEIGTSYDLASS